MTELIDTDELIKRLSTINKKLTKKSIYRMRKQGLPCLKPGGNVLFDWPDVVNWLKLQNKPDHMVGES